MDVKAYVGSYCVSTVELPFGGFETMVFRVSRDGKVNLDELDVARYRTAAGAIAGHDRIVERWQLVADSEAVNA